MRGPAPVDEARLRSWALAQGHDLGPGLRWIRTTSEASLAFGADLVAKVHAARTDRTSLAPRIAAADSAALGPWLVRPVTTAIGSLPPDGRLVTLWPRVTALDPDLTEAEDLPWPDLGRHLAGLHAAAPPADLPPHAAVDRVRRALGRLDHTPGPLRDLGRRLVRAADAAHARHPALNRLVHGDWHLGQLTRMPDGWRLLDVDDLGVGDPAWDLGRTAGFWAAGLLPDEAWDGFLAGYRAGGGPAVDRHGDPWPALDLPARCEVFLAACREQRRADEGHSSPTADALLSACARM